ncbi:hypothetical protein GGI15_001578 [Coemansia interrupta]|uniref:Uncharacterized protein n=1 Tax=Coemansia interrupta TaxID=1126814 RepID=A0A9W8HL17_9FUNG|nr:hypothetical protein GGI15_001578 [Coemansia interrupta]
MIWHNKALHSDNAATQPHREEHHDSEQQSTPPNDSPRRQSGEQHHNHYRQHIFEQLRHHSRLGSGSHGQSQDGNGVIYTQASDFVLPEEVDKQMISGPVSARPMGDIDLTANDWVMSSGSPSHKELHLLKKHAKQTAHVLGTSPKKVLGEAHEP